MRVKVQSRKTATRLDLATEEYRLWAKTQGSRSKESDENRRFRLECFVHWCHQEHNIVYLESVTTTMIAEYVEYLFNRTTRTGMKPAVSSVASYVTCLKAFYHWLASDDCSPVMVGIVTHDFCARIHVPSAEPPVVGVFTIEHIDAMMRACNKRVSEDRDRAIVSVLASSGLRAQELCNLTIRDCHLDKPDGSTLTVVHGKGDKPRDVPIPRACRDLLIRYLKRFRPETEEPYAFVSYTGKQLTASGLYKIIEDLGNTAHVTGVRISPHTFRHFYAYSLKVAGYEDSKVMKLLGHKSLLTTQRYTAQFSSKDVLEKGFDVLDFMRSREQGK